MTSLSDIKTPPKATADFCLIPLGTPTASVSEQIADVQRLLKQSSLKYTMHSAGTTVEGSWDDVMKVIGQAHQMLHEKGIVRIQSDIRAGSRTDKSQTAEDKVNAVERLLRADAEDGGEEPGMKHTKEGTRDAPNAATGASEVSSVIPS